MYDSWQLDVAVLVVVVGVLLTIWIVCAAAFVVETDWWVIARGMVRGEGSRLKRASRSVGMAVTTATSAPPCGQRPHRFRTTRVGRQT